jgi:predicted ribosome quality control (RQC) complex YloA/Tae2 family protein
MKIEEVFIASLDESIEYYIGENKHDNFEILDVSYDEDIWFHAKDESSCHVIAKIDHMRLDKKSLRQIIKQGCLLCKQYTNKLNGKKEVEFIYTERKNVAKTKVIGMVTHRNSKSLVC